jgi:hypothetical protein
MYVVVDCSQSINQDVSKNNGTYSNDHIQFQPDICKHTGIVQRCICYSLGNHLNLSAIDLCMYMSRNHDTMADECMCLLPHACLAGLDRFHVRDAVRLAGADRIGHGVALQWEDDSKGTLKYMADNKVCAAGVFSA